jgi:small subunit ribosomal protein S4
LAVREKSRSTVFFKDLPVVAEKYPSAIWVERNINQMSGRVLRLPERGEIDGNLNEQLIVEYYSR